MCAFDEPPPFIPPDPASCRGASADFLACGGVVLEQFAPAEAVATFVAAKMHFSKMHFSKILQIFCGLVLGCIKTKFCKKICV